MASYNEEEETGPILPRVNQLRRNSITSQPLNETLLANQILLANQTLNRDYYDWIEEFNGLNISASSFPSHLHQHQNNPYNTVPPVSQPTVNGVANGSFLENQINNDPSMTMNHQGFIPQYAEAYIYYQWLLRNPDYNRARMAASLMRGYSSAPVIPQGFEGYSVSRFNHDSAIKPEDLQACNGCRCGGPSCRTHSRVQSSPELSQDSQRYRTRSTSNLSGFRFDSGRNRVGGGGGEVNGSVSNLDSLNLPRSQLNNGYIQPLLQNPNGFLQMRGKLLAMAKDQHGCRFLQKKFEEGKAEEIQVIFSELKSHVSNLMVDPFGNYLVQKLLEVCNEEQMTEILHVVTRTQYELVDICLNTHGTRSVQKLLALLTTQQQISRVMSALRNGVVMLTKDQNGHHVIQYCLKHFSNEDNKYLFNAIADHCVEIAMDRSGCCVLQQCVLCSNGELNERFVAEITANALVLAQDPFGNYVVQFLVAMKIKRITRDLVRQLKGNFESLSTQKFSSNLVEKFIKESHEEESTEVIKELIYDSNVLMILQDQYGNYVIQTAMTESKWFMFNAIAKVIEVHSQSLRNHPYGKRVIGLMNMLIKQHEQQQYHHHQQHRHHHHQHHHHHHQ